MSIAKNKKAYHDYEILKEFEAGIVLTGNEIKSIHERKVNLKDSFIKINYQGELFLYNMHVSPYEKAHKANSQDATRARKLLMHRKEINKLSHELKGTGLTLVPVTLYFKNNKVKVRVALARGKKTHDKRNALKEKTMQRDIQKSLKNKY